MHLIGLYCPCTRQQDLARLSENGLLPTSKRKNVVRFQTFITRIPLFVPSHFYSTRATKEALASLVIPFQGTFSAWIYMNKLQLHAWTFFIKKDISTKCRKFLVANFPSGGSLYCYNWHLMHLEVGGLCIMPGCAIVVEVATTKNCVITCNWHAPGQNLICL